MSCSLKNVKLSSANKYYDKETIFIIRLSLSLSLREIHVYQYQNQDQLRSKLGHIWNQYFVCLFLQLLRSLAKLANWKVGGLKMNIRSVNNRYRREQRKKRRNIYLSFIIG